jgi:hypothetical protein
MHALTSSCCPSAQHSAVQCASPPSCQRRELCALVGVVKLVGVTAACHMEPAARKACVLQLSCDALADVALTVDHLMARTEYALAHGTSQGEVDLLGRIARDLVPASSDSFMRAVDAQIIHMVATWSMCENEVCIPRSRFWCVSEAMCPHVEMSVLR